MKETLPQDYARRCLARVVAASALCTCSAFAYGGGQAAPSFPVASFRFEGNQLIDDATLQQAVAGWRGEARQLSDLLAVKKAIADLYEADGWRMVAVGLPTRINADGIVAITLRELPLGGIQVSGQRQSTEADIRAALPALQENAPLNFNRLAAQLALSNDNPVRRLAVDFSADDPRGTQAKVRVEESDPMRFAITVDNTGTGSSGRYRIGGNIQHHNLWGLGHSLIAGLTTSEQGAGKLIQAYVQYQAPLPALGGQLNIGTSYSDANSGVVAEVFNVSGQGYNYGAHYTHFLSRDAVSRQVLDIGYDEKQNRNTLDFFGANLGVDVDARPLSVAWQASRQEQGGAWSTSLSYARNLVFGPRNDNATYNASRAGARADWDVWRLSGDTTLNLPADWRLRVKADGQHAGQALISGEQIGLGGAQGIRGFDEREVPGDDGLRASVEIYTPLLFGQTSRFLAFADAGAIRRENPQTGEPGRETIASVGLGWRLQLGRNLNARLDAAHVTNGAATTGKGDNMLHFQLTASF